MYPPPHMTCMYPPPLLTYLGYRDGLAVANVGKVLRRQQDQALGKFHVNPRLRAQLVEYVEVALAPLLRHHS